MAANIIAARGASLFTTLAQAGLTSTEADTWTLQSRDPTS